MGSTDGMLEERAACDRVILWGVSLGRSELPVLLHAFRLFLYKLSAWAATEWRWGRKGEGYFLRAPVWSRMCLWEACLVGERTMKQLGDYIRACLSAGETECCGVEEVHRRRDVLPQMRDHGEFTQANVTPRALRCSDHTLHTKMTIVH
jgi:hypothetical protein